MGVVGKAIKWILNHIPRPLLQKVAGWGVPMLGLWYAGRGRKCPICGKQVREFLPTAMVYRAEMHSAHAVWHWSDTACCGSTLSEKQTF